MRLKSWLVFIPFFVLALLSLCGCYGLDTHNVTVSTSIRRVAMGEDKIDLMSRFGLICVFTDEVSPTQFFLRDKKNNTTSTATIDKDAFAAFFCMPGTYYFQKRSWVKLSAGSVLLLHTNRNSTHRIYQKDFPRGAFLTKKIEGDGINIIPADVFIPDLCGTGYRIVYYSTKAVINTILSPFYIIWGTSFMLNNIAHKAMNDSGDPRFMIGGALVYFLTLWSAVIMERPGALCYSGEIGAPSSAPPPAPAPATVMPPPTYLTSSTIETEPPFRKRNNFAPAFTPPPPVIQENVFGPGIHQNQFGQPVRYHVPNWPANEPTQFLQVKPNVYGPGIGQDQFGRPVTTRPAF